MELLDNENAVRQRDPKNALKAAATETDQLRDTLEIINAQRPNDDIETVVVTGMGGSALGAAIAKDWLNLSIPFEVVRNYDLPAYVDEHTLVVVNSYSGNTEETVSTLLDAIDRGAIVAVIATGGKLIDIAQERMLPYIAIPKVGDIQPRMAVFSMLLGLLTFLEHFGVVREVTLQLLKAGGKVADAVDAWAQDVPVHENIAKQLALELAGKTPVIYASGLMRSVAYKWKISFNENAKNVAFMNELSEFDHNEFAGWSSHPIEKPFGVIDLRSSFDHPRITTRFEIGDRLLSGKRPKATVIQLQGDSVLEQMLWGSLFADFVSIYLAILNGVDPSPVAIIEKLKEELAQ